MTETASARRLTLADFAHVADQRLHMLLGHWLDLRGADLAPRRSAIDPAAIAPLLSGVWMCDYEPAQGRFRMRLAGEDINLLYGRNVSNCDFENVIAPGMLADVVRRYRRIIEEPSIMHCRGHIYMASGRAVVGERLVLPLSDDQGALVHAIGASLFRLNSWAEDGPLADETMAETFTAIAVARAA